MDLKRAYHQILIADDIDMENTKMLCIAITTVHSRKQSRITSR